MKVYIAGPMTGLPEFNFPAFDKAQAELENKGLMVVNPAKLADHTDKPWAWYMRNSLKAMLDCNAIYLLPGWEKSRGARLELKIALELGFVAKEYVNGKFQLLEIRFGKIKWLKGIL